MLVKGKENITVIFLKKLLNLIMLDGKLRCLMVSTMGSVFLILGGRRDTLKKMD